MSICREYKNYFYDRQTYSNLDFRKEICRFIRLNQKKGFDKLWWVIASILNNSLSAKSNKIYLKNRRYEAGIIPLDVYHFYLEGVVKVILTSPKDYLKTFEFTNNIKNFENICGNILNKIHANNVLKSIKYSEDIKNNIEFDYYEKYNNGVEGKKLTYKRILVNPDYTTKIQKVQIRRSVRKCIKGMNNPNRRKVFRKLLAGRSTDQISFSLGMPENTVYSHVHRGKRELRAFFEKYSLVA